ncbi:MAG: ABC transporter ATP-binding protein [Lachnospirales bacterium]
MKFEIKNVSKSFGDKKVLEDLNFHCESGQAIALLGKNGAGKTTLFRCILDIYKEDNGEFLLDGENLRKKKIKIGYLPEERGLYLKRKVYDQLLYFAKLKGLNKNTADKMIDLLLERLDITIYKNEVLDNLSKGNKQKVQLAVSVIDNPDIVIFDEPFSGLDPVSSMSLKNLILDFVKNGKIVIFSSHEMGYVEEFCKDIAILNNGKIETFGKLEDIKNSYPSNKVKISFKESNNLENIVTDEDLKSLCSDIKKDEDEFIFILKEENLVNELQKALFNKEYYYNRFEVIRPTLEEIFVMKVGGEDE